VLHGELQLDDLREIQANPALRDLGGAARAAARGALLGGGRPLTDLTFALDRRLFGPGVAPLHATSLALHLLAAALVWGFTRRILARAGAARAGPVALAVAGLFALHPIQTEAVSYLSQRSEVLASALYVAALLALLAADDRGRSRAGVAAWAAGLAAFALALAAKPVAVTLPLAWLLVAVAVPPRGPGPGLRWRERLLLAAPLIALGAVHAWRGLAGAAGSPHAGFSVPGLGPGEYLSTQPRALATYLRLLVWPAGQNVDWAIPAAPTIADPAAMVAGLLPLAVAAAGLALLAWARRRGAGDGHGTPAGADAAAARVAGLGLLWFFLLLAPTSSVVPLADALVEHRLYLASWGPFAAAAVLAERALARVRWRHAGTAGAAVVGAAWLSLALATFARNAVWETRVALWSDAAAKSPGKARVHLGLGHALRERWDLGNHRAVVDDDPAGLHLGPELGQTRRIEGHQHMRRR
jgi:hypothetical protein